MRHEIPDTLLSRAVLLRHELPGGAFHLDLMMQPPGGGRLVSFRVHGAIDSLEERFEAVRIQDHREAYLDYEGELSQGRGRVRRLASGVCHICADSGGVFAAVIDFGSGRELLEGQAGPEERWCFRRVPLGRPGSELGL